MLLLAKILGLLVTPPGIIIVLGLTGLLLQFRWRPIGIGLLAVSVLALYFLSLPVTGRYLMAELERSAPVLPSADTATRTGVGAIVILGGGRWAAAPEYGEDTVSGATLERLRYGVELHRRTRLPMLVTSGSPFGETVSEAELMQRTLTEAFAVRAVWVENRSNNTHENALYSRAILEAAGVRRVLLVTHAWHMSRAVWSFREAGVDVVPAPMGFQTRGPAAFDYLPSAPALAASSRALSERLGLLWYRLNYKEPNPPRPAATAPARSG